MSPLGLLVVSTPVFIEEEASIEYLMPCCDVRAYVL